MDINIFSYFDAIDLGLLGICVHSVFFKRALSYYANVKEYDLGNKHVQFTHADNNIIINHANNFKFFSTLSKKIGYTFFEGTIFNNEWVEGMNLMDQIWVPSTWGKEIILNHDVTKPVHVVPEGINPTLFFPKKQTHVGFRFLCIGKYEERKSIKELAKAFTEEFHDDKNVYLVINCHMPFLDNKNIIFNKTIEKYAEVPDLYNSCDAFVLPTKAEAWGLPILEAMACGLPVITTNYSGQTEFVNDNNIFPVNYNLAPTNQKHGAVQGEWAIPDVEHLKHQMRYVYTNFHKARDKAMETSKIIREKWTWENSAKKAFALLK